MKKTKTRKYTKRKAIKKLPLQTRVRKWLFKSRRRSATVFVLLFALIGTGYILYSRAAVNNGSGSITIIMLGRHADTTAAIDKYQPLVNSSTNLAFRSLEPKPDNFTIVNWQNVGRKYFYTTASSDFPVTFNHPSLYVPVADANTVLNRSHNKGLYFHELVSYHAASNGWNWQAAVNAVSWSTLDQQVMAAKSKGKKVVWSEPSYGWQNLNSNPTASAYLAKWGNTLVPMFGTNFPNNLTAARDGAVATAKKYNMASGESVQSWYFRDRGLAPTVQGTVDLAKIGQNAGSTYFQIEGTEQDIVWGTEYMKGINQFTNQLAPAAPAPAPAPTTSTPYWRGWSSKGGNFISKPTAISRGSNRIDVFAVGTDYKVYMKSWNGSSWSGWNSLGGSTSHGPGAISWASNRIDLLIRRKSDGALQHKYWNGSSWSGWNNVGGYISSAPSVVTGGAGHLDVYARGDNNGIKHKYLYGGKWSAWEYLGGDFRGNPTAVSWGSGRIDVFGRGSDNQMLHKWFSNWQWSNGWYPHGGVLTSGPSAATMTANHLDVFVKGTDNSIYHKWWINYAWHGWASIGGSNVADSDPGAVSWGWGRMDVFVKGRDGAIWHSYYQ